MTNPNYDYVTVDPKVIAAFGGDVEFDASEDLNESFSPQPSISAGFKIPDMLPPVNPMPMNDGGVVDVLKEIVKELQEIKVILAGK